jgi:O-antigen/teichoic acid export membrane protein
MGFPSILRIDRNLRADFSWMLSGNVIYSACQWGIILLLAKLGSAEQVGMYALGMAVCAPIILFANLQLRTLLASDVQDEFRFGHYVAFRVVSLLLAFLAVVIVAFWSAPDPLRRGVIILVGFAQVLEYVSDLYYGLMQRCDRMDRLSRSLMVKGPLALGALCVTMYFTRDVFLAVAALALGRLCVLCFYDARLGYARKAWKGISARLEWSPAVMARLFRLALPLGIISMLAALTSNIPRYFIEAHLGTRELGIYSAIASLLTAGTLFISAFGQSIMVPAAKACAAGDRYRYRGFVLQTMAIGALPGLGAVLAAVFFGPFLLGKLFRPEYRDHVDVFIWLMIAGTVLFAGGGLGFIMTAARVLVPQIPLLAANCATAALASAVWVPKYGLKGAAAAVLAAALVQMIGSLCIIWKIDRRMEPSPLPVGMSEPAYQGAEIN